MPTKIPWADEVWNPVTGCTPVSAGCAHCYAQRMASRMKGRFGYPADAPFRPTCHPNRLDQPLRWQRGRSIFVASMGDVFHPEIPVRFVRKIWATMQAAYLARWDAEGDELLAHDFIIFTKRPDRMRDFVDVYGVPPHVWLGVSVEDQPTWDGRVRILAEIRAQNKVVSVEPLLDEIDPEPLLSAAGIKQIIIGCESGPGRRPMAWSWERRMLHACSKANIPCFVKQHALDLIGTGRLSRPEPKPGEIAWARP